jgi:putative ABC transport system permease protein
MLAHFTKMALKALIRFKLHTTISMASLVIGFLCFTSAILLAEYSSSFDRHFPNADNIYNIMIRAVGDSPVPDRFPIVNQPTARYLRTAFPEIPNIARASSGFPVDATVDGQTVSLDTKFVEPRFFDIFPLETLYGLEAGAELPPNSVMISESAAMRIYGRTDIVGERLLLSNKHDLIIAGVAKTLENPSHLESSIALFHTELYVPMEVQDREIREAIIASGGDPNADRWGNQSDFVYLEFPEGVEVDVAAFNEQLGDFVQRYMPQDRAELQTFELLPVSELIPTQMAFITAGFDITDILIVAGSLVLLIGCLNYSNLVIAQLSLRSLEVGVQKILGAKRSLLILQYCFESLMFLGIALAATLMILLLVLGQLGEGMVGVAPSMLLNPDLWSSLAIVLVVIVVIAGGYPALRTALVPLVSMLRPKGSSGYSGRLRAVMVGVQFFISGTLMILAMVMFGQNRAMTQQLDGGRLDPKIVISVSTDTFTADPELVANQLKQHPSVLSITQIDTQPWNISSSSISFSRESDPNATTFEMGRHWVGYEFSETMSQPLIAGRDFSRERSSDLVPPFAQLSSTSGPFAIVIDDQAAQSFGWVDATAAIGDSVFMQIGPPSIEQELLVEFNIIGAMSPRKYEFIDFGAFGIQGHVYMLKPDSADNMIVKASRTNLNEALQHIESTWTALMPDIPLRREYVDDLFYNTYGIFLSVSVAIGALSIFGFLVASIGLLGNATFITNIRQKEVGIRKVMGASSGKLFRMLLMDFTKPIVIANALAWPLGYVMGNAYTSLFAARAEVTIVPFLVSLLLSAAIAFVAVYSQSWKSARLRPAMVLKYE